MCLSDIKVTSETSTFKIYPLALSILLWHVSVRNVNDFIQSLSTQTSLNSKEGWTGNAERDGKVWECRFFCQLLYPAWPWESDTFKSLFKSGGTDHLHTLLHRAIVKFGKKNGIWLILEDRIPFSLPRRESELINKQEGTLKPKSTKNILWNLKIS